MGGCGRSSFAPIARRPQPFSGEMGVLHSLQSMVREIPCTCGVRPLLQSHGVCDSWGLGRLVFTPITWHPRSSSGELCIFPLLRSHDGGHSMYAWCSAFALILRCRQFLGVGAFGLCFITTASLAALSGAVHFLLRSNPKAGEIPDLLHYSLNLTICSNRPPPSHHKAGRLSAHHVYHWICRL